MKPPPMERKGAVAAVASEMLLDPNGRNARLRIHIGEDKRHGDQPLDIKYEPRYRPLPPMPPRISSISVSTDLTPGTAAASLRAL